MKLSTIIYTTVMLSSMAGAFLFARMFIKEIPTPLPGTEKVSTKPIVASDTASITEGDKIYFFRELQGNTANIDGTRFFSVKLLAIIPDRLDHPLLQTLETNPALESQKAKIRDLILTTFTSKTAKELQSIEVKEEIKRSLKANLNRMLGEGSIKKVYYGDFVVQ